MSITGIAIKRPLLLIVIFTVLILFGLQSYRSLNYNLLPKIDLPTVSISTLYPGAAAAEVQTTVTKKLEDAFSAVEGLDQINSTSQQSLSIITITFKSGTNIDQAERDVQRKADQIRNDLPTDAGKPKVSKVNLEETPVIKAGVTASMAPRDLYDLVNNQLRPILQNVAGVGQVNMIGGDEREIQININQDKLLNYGLSISRITEAVSNANLSFPAGSIETQNQQLSIRYDANLRSLDQLRELIILQQPGQGAICLKDIAEVVDATAKTTAINHIDGIPSIGVQIIKQSDANAVEVSKKIKQAFDDIQNQYIGQQLQFNISVDQSVYTLHAANAVMFDLMLAVLIVGIVMLAFLHSLRSSLFILIALPSSIIPTFMAMYLLGFSLNLMTLMAMSLVVGILVDDSIVVLENIYRHMEMGADKRKAALEGRNEIGFTALAITLVDVVVFLPLALAGGMIGAILREFSLVVVASTLMSLFVSFTITPLLASRFGKLEHLKENTLWGKINLAFERFIDTLREAYAKILQQLLHKKRYLLSGTILLIVGSIALVPMGFIGAAFIPKADQSNLVLNMELEPTATIYRTNTLVQQAEEFLLKQPEVEKVFSSIGFVTGSVSGTSSNNNLAELTLTLVDKEKRTMSAEDYGTFIQQKLSSLIAGAKFSVLTTSITGNVSNAPIQIAVKGVDLKEVRRIAEAYQKIVQETPGTQFVKLSVKDPKAEIDIKLNREKMSLLGLNAATVGAALQNAFSGIDKSLFRQGANEYNIMVSLDRFNRSDIRHVRNLPFVNTQGHTILLSQFADVTETLGETTLQRIDRLGAITIQANVAGRPTGTVSDEIKAKAQSVKIPNGISINYLGDSKNQKEAFGSLGLALITAILLVYLIMVALYENAVYPFVVLFSIPVALVGAFLALALTMETLNIFTIIGMIMLLGLVAKNAILIVDFTNHLKEKGASVTDALIEAGRERLRPILMTTLAMIFGMLPIAMASGAAAEIKNGMAWVIIGGLTSSMILTLFVVPAMYLIIANIITRLSKRKKRSNPVTWKQ
ncbi:efflux RND transporter permease subunit [Paraflavitalea soli]|uniref:Efflux RND transporter permease subunit n=1 Tax=Paraflavitalea soli TaxID=2315862 RepID=A0A3B7MHK7_9BACT|nr:efflux RND transporter permease subunit [Paraflavitalea soli]AXY72566.1 efflux RND transporter permease subunit [Paraflavitalea soli]